MLSWKLFACVCWCPVHVGLSFSFVFLLLFYPVSPVSLDFPFLIAPSVFSGIYLFYYLHFSQSDVRHPILLYTIFSFAVIGVEEIFTVWASTDPVLGLYLIQWNLSKPNLLGTKFCVWNRQVFSLYRLN